jgi:hypothetical protein
MGQKPQVTQGGTSCFLSPPWDQIYTAGLSPLDTMGLPSLPLSIHT